eukprot:5918323-Karenia_brevis.AAC.1
MSKVDEPGIQLDGPQHLTLPDGSVPRILTTADLQPTLQECVSVINTTLRSCTPCGARGQGLLCSYLGMRTSIFRRKGFAVLKLRGSGSFAYTRERGSVIFGSSRSSFWARFPSRRERK